MTPGERADLAIKIVEVMTACRDGYRDNIRPSKSDQDNEIAKQCAIAASNTGYFILKALGYTSEEIRALADRETSS
jgi:hypothetical protein